MAEEQEKKVRRKMVVWAWLADWINSACCTPKNGVYELVIGGWSFFFDDILNM
jgi:hypothetical protein